VNRKWVLSFKGLCVGGSLDLNFPKYYNKKWSPSSHSNGVLVNFGGLLAVRLVKQHHRAFMAPQNALGFS